MRNDGRGMIPSPCECGFVENQEGGFIVSIKKDIVLDIMDAHRSKIYNEAFWCNFGFVIPRDESES